MIITKIAGNRLRIKTGYSRDLIDAIKECPDGRRWNPAAKAWDIPVTADNLKYLLYDLKVAKMDGSGWMTERLAELQRPLDKTTKTKDPAFLTKPFKHQVTGFHLAMNHPHLALFWEQGTGKTWVGVNAIKAKAPRKALIVCPKTVLGSWDAELKKHGAMTATTITSKNKDKLQQPGGIFLINYDLLIWIEDDLLAAGFDFIILDESHFIKNISAQRSKLTWKICSAIPNRLIFSGTPVTERPEDIFSQFMAMDQGETFGQNFFCFRNRYFINKGYDYPDWQLKDGALATIREKIQAKSHRVTKAECFDLPEKNYQEYEIEMQPEQARIYRELERQLFTELEDSTAIAIRYETTKLIRLNQVTSGFISQDDKVHEIKHGKLEAAIDLVQDKPKAIIWCLFRHDIDALMARLAKEQIEAVEISGTTSTANRAENVRRFQEGTARVLVGQIHAGGIGTTLTAAQFVVYYSQAFSLTDRLQSEDRSHRIGTTGTVTYVTLVCPGTIDQDIQEALAEKREVADYVTGDKDLAETILAKFKRRNSSKATKALR